MQQQGMALRLFEGREVRTTWYEGEWWYSTADAVGAFADATDPRKYWSVLKGRLRKDGVQVTTKCSHLKMVAPDGKLRQVDASNEEMLLRIIQSMPTARVEHIRQWLAQVGAERLQEERNPSLSVSRAMDIHQRRYGMSEMEAAQTVQATAARKALTGLWKVQGIQKNQDYAILTNVGHEATFDVSVREHKVLKGLPKRGESLRPHMTGVELALTMLQENTEQELIRQDDLKGLHAIKDAAQVSGEIAGRARRDIEARTGKSVVSPFNRKRKPLPSDSSPPADPALV